MRKCLNELTEKENIDLITINAIKTLIEYTKDPHKIGAYSVDVRGMDSPVHTVEIRLTYWKAGHPLDRRDRDD